MKRLPSLAVASFLVVTGTAIAAPAAVGPLHSAQPQCGDDHDKKGDSKDEKKDDKEKKGDKSGETKPKSPAFN